MLSESGQAAWLGGMARILTIAVNESLTPGPMWFQHGGCLPWSTGDAGEVRTAWIHNENAAMSLGLAVKPSASPEANQRGAKAGPARLRAR